jgi:cell division protein FtsB
MSPRCGAATLIQRGSAPTEIPRTLRKRAAVDDKAKNQGFAVVVKKTIYLLMSFFLVWLCLLFFTGHRSFLTFLHSRDATDDLKNRIEALQRENEKLRQQITKLEGDPAEVERLAREQLGLVKPGEVVYEFVDEHLEQAPENP